MFPDAISTIIIRVIYSILEWTDDEGNALTVPTRRTDYMEFKPSLTEAHKGLWLELDQKVTDADPLRPRFKVDELWLKAWCLEKIEGPSLAYSIVKAIEDKTPVGRSLEGLEIHAVATWTPAHRHPDALLRFAAKHTYRTETRDAIEAELDYRKAKRAASAPLAETQQKRAARNAAMELAAHR